MRFTVGLDDKAANLVVDLHDNAGQALGHAVLDARAADALIAQLGGARAQLSDEPPDELEAGARVTATVDPLWQVAEGLRGPDNDLAVLALRHAGFGWLTFALPRDTALLLARSLADEASAAPVQ